MAHQKIFSSESDEDTWVINLNQLINNETNNYQMILKNMAVCIYQIPKSLSCDKPEAFIPQLIAIGPYNHFRPELNPPPRFKIISAQSILDHFNKHGLERIVKELYNTERFFRACYDKDLDIKDSTLIHSIAFDGLFLLDLLHNYLDQINVSGSFLTGIEKHTKDVVIRDVLMVDNQIPTFILRRILILLIESPESTIIHSVEEHLGSMLLSFCKKHCPLKLTQTWSQAHAMRYHLLDLMYHLVVPENESSETSEREDMDDASATDALKSKRSSISEGIVTFKNVVKIPLTWTSGYLQKLKGLRLPFLRPIKSSLDGTLSMFNLYQSVSSETSTFETEAAVVVIIPSVSELHSFGIRFQPTNGGIMAIEFDERKCIFYLPVIKLNVNSEVIMRNLVAYEALTNSDFLIFRRYIELMQAMIHTVEDVKMLKDAAIIESTSSINEEETVKLFNGMSKSIGPTKTEKLDETIKKVNKCFNDKKKSSITNYVYNSWKFFTFLATFVLLAMTALQTFCTVYDCPSQFKEKSTNSLSVIDMNQTSGGGFVDPIIVPNLVSNLKGNISLYFHNYRLENITNSLYQLLFKKNGTLLTDY